MKKNARDYAIPIRLSAKEKEWLDALVDKTGLSMADVFRLALRREYAKAEKDESYDLAG